MDFRELHQKFGCRTCRYADQKDVYENACCTKTGKLDGCDETGRCKDWLPHRQVGFWLNHIVKWQGQDREMIGNVKEVSNDGENTIILRVQHFNGESAGNIDAAHVTIIEPDESDYEKGDE